MWTGELRHKVTSVMAEVSFEAGELFLTLLARKQSTVIMALHMFVQVAHLKEGRVADDTVPLAGVAGVGEAELTLHLVLLTVQLISEALETNLAGVRPLMRLKVEHQVASRTT